MRSLHDYNRCQRSTVPAISSIRLLDAIFIGRISRHVLCPLFSSARKERDRPPLLGPKEGHRRVYRFGLRSGRKPGSRMRYGYSLRTDMDRGGGRAGLSSGCRRHISWSSIYEVVQPRTGCFMSCFHACHGSSRRRRCLEPNDRRWARKTRH
jgi:hypothetical protein